MIDFASLVGELEAELSATMLRRHDCGAEITRLTLQVDSCLAIEGHLCHAIDAVRALDKWQRNGAAATSLAAVSLERAFEVLSELAAGEGSPSPLTSPVPGEGEEVAAASSPVGYRLVGAARALAEAGGKEENPSPLSSPVPGEGGEVADVAEARDPLAPYYSEPSPLPVATAAEPEAPSTVAAPTAAAAAEGAAPAGEVPIGEGRKLANRIAAEFSTLIQEFPEGPTIRQLTEWFEAPDIRVRDACRILATAKTAALQKRKSTGYLHLLPIGARP